MAMLQAKTDLGTVQGVRGNNPFFTVFRGIPFMAPPVGDNRWRAPQPAAPWDGVRKCDTFAPTAMQPAYNSDGGLIAAEFYGVERPMSEDCMYLNIWTPANSADEKLPVAVYFHGGAYTTGMAYQQQFDGEGFNKRGVIMVTIPYRLNVFGFMAHPELTAEAPYQSSGNYGLLDQVYGLQWVKRNIASFGGDPDNMSIFGQSAGAMSVNAMITTPLTKGLFHRAILQSGGGLSHGKLGSWSDNLEKAEQLGIHFLNYIGCASIAEARQLSQEKLLAEMMRYCKEKLFDSDTHYYAGGYTRFMPIHCDGYVFPQNRGNMCLDGEHADIDYILGSTADEWRYMTEDNLAFAENQLLLNRNPAYLYYLSDGPPGADAEGAHHSVEHHYVFQTMYRTRRPYKGFDFDLSNELADRWAAFFTTGNPNCPEYVKWTPYTKENPQVLGITQIGRIMEPLPVNEEERQNAMNQLKYV
ncbi:MAG: carboxylesterase family protein [Lachnospiraceae bacterium]|nr:carboxylesterase family protein [Lachnospiraceae bacterium]